MQVYAASNISSGTIVRYRITSAFNRARKRRLHGVGFGTRG